MRAWTRYPKQRLLDVRLCELKLSLKGSFVDKLVRQVRNELRERDLRFHPYFWVSDDWFTPEGMTGTGVPFYLVHPRLKQLERSVYGEVEGGTRDWCLRIIRHEIGHALDHAYKLNLRRKRQQLFGPSSRRYPWAYRPNPYSKRHVQHLSYWYAQSHPDEDFVETFAVWLKPGSRWKSKYRGWPVIKKLEYMDELMEEIAGTRPPVHSRGQVDPLSGIKKTLREHYREKMGGPELPYPDYYDDDLKQLFHGSTRNANLEAASAFIRRVRAEVVRAVTPWIGDFRYQSDHVLVEMIGRSRELKLKVRGAEKRLQRELSIVVTKHTMDSLFRRKREVEM